MARKLTNVYNVTINGSPVLIEAYSIKELCDWCAHEAAQGKTIGKVVVINADGSTPLVSIQQLNEYKSALDEYLEIFGAIQ